MVVRCRLSLGHVAAVATALPCRSVPGGPRALPPGRAGQVGTQLQLRAACLRGRPPPPTAHRGLSLAALTSPQARVRSAFLASELVLLSLLTPSVSSAHTSSPGSSTSWASSRSVQLTVSSGTVQTLRVRAQTPGASAPLSRTSDCRAVNWEPPRPSAQVWKFAGMVPRTWES